MANALVAVPVVAALLLLGAGISKVIAPSSAVSGLVAVGMPVTTWLVRVGALAEAVLGLVNLIGASAMARVLMVVSYLCFAIYLQIARRSPAVKSCGCFGERGSPPTVRQVIVDLLIAIGCGASIVVGCPSLPSVISAHVLFGVLFTMLCVLTAWLATFVLDSPVSEV